MWLYLCRILNYNRQNQMLMDLIPVQKSLRILSVLLLIAVKRPISNQARKSEPEQIKKMKRCKKVLSVLRHFIWVFKIRVQSLFYQPALLFFFFFFLNRMTENITIPIININGQRLTNPMIKLNSNFHPIAIACPIFEEKLSVELVNS